MKAQILKVWAQIAQFFDPMPKLLPHFWGASISSAPKTNKLIAKSGKKHKFWDFEAQIEHKFFEPWLTPWLKHKFWKSDAQIAQVFDPLPKLLSHFWGLAFPQLPKTDKLIGKSGEKCKFWDFEAQIEHKFFEPWLTP